jgi:hypothetical protein
MIDKLGYGRPPAGSRFKPGKSGNPGGRPKQAPTFMSDLLAELSQEIGVTGQQGLSVTRQRAVIKTLVREAVAGNLRAIALLLPVLTRGAENDEEAQTTSPEDRKILDGYVARELKRRAQDKNTAESLPAANEKKE